VICVLVLLFGGKTVGAQIRTVLVSPVPGDPVASSASAQASDPEKEDHTATKREESVPPNTAFSYSTEWPGYRFREILAPDGRVLSSVKEPIPGDASDVPPRDAGRDPHGRRITIKSLSSYMQDIKLIAGTSSSVSCPTGYTKMTTDLNLGAGGKYIYLCWTKETNYRQYGIYDIGIYNSGNTNWFQTMFFNDGHYGYYYGGDTTMETSHDYLVWLWDGAWWYSYGTQRYVKVAQEGNGDLNQGAGGDYIWMIPAGGSDHVREIGFISSNGSQPTGCGSLSGYTFKGMTINDVNADLNRNAGGWWQYLCVKY